MCRSSSKALGVALAPPVQQLSGGEHFLHETGMRAALNFIFSSPSSLVVLLSVISLVSGIAIRYLK